MAQTSTTRRSFFGLAGGAALFCTIGGREVDVSARGGLEKADAAAASVSRPRAAAAQTVPQIQPAPGGARREYWVQAETCGGRSRRRAATTGTAAGCRAATSTRRTSTGS